MSLNRVQLIGNVGKDPDVRYLDNGVAVAAFSLATTEKGYTLANGTQVPERTEWHNIVLWRGWAEMAEKYLHKGDKVYIEGKIEEKFFRTPEMRKEKGDPPFDFKIKKVIHLGNVVENYIKGFTIFIKTSMLSSEFREDLVNIVRHNTGSVPLTMFLEDPEQFNRTILDFVEHYTRA